MYKDHHPIEIEVIHYIYEMICIGRTVFYLEGEGEGGWFMQFRTAEHCYVVSIHKGTCFFKTRKFSRKKPFFPTKIQFEIKNTLGSLLKEKRVGCFYEMCT